MEVADIIGVPIYVDIFKAHLAENQSDSADNNVRKALD